MQYWWFYIPRFVFALFRRWRLEKFYSLKDVNKLNNEADDDNYDMDESDIENLVFANYSDGDYRVGLLQVEMWEWNISTCFVFLIFQWLLLSCLCLKLVQHVNAVLVLIPMFLQLSVIAWLIPATAGKLVFVLVQYLYFTNNVIILCSISIKNSYKNNKLLNAQNLH